MNMSPGLLAERVSRCRHELPDAVGVQFSLLSLSGDAVQRTGDCLTHSVRLRMADHEVT